MAESATAAAQQAQQSSSRIRLNIKIKAPVVIVPQGSNNNNAIVVDLGNIAIGNVFKGPDVGHRDVGGVSAPGASVPGAFGGAQPLHPVITMSEGDLKTLMGMLNENLAEGQPAERSEAPQALPPTTVAAGMMSGPRPAPHHSSHRYDVRSKPCPPPQ
ncbi:hypothetical protein NP493_702g01022 [Ridgeia piscesae]|uniref:Uncharacterized protein n=1 Tax=Ridgeia piscesae TaxID=27915 RepID=A0AAD9KQT7_RIDPI|nr:hypothetical protein NP493_702g01022 [Ridgeia piscesae]